MIGDKINIKEDYFSLAENIYEEGLKDIISNHKKICLSIAGESGCGKSVTAEVFKLFLLQKGIETVCLQQDDYFLLPPKSNHEARLKNINNVGFKEINASILQQNINDFKNAKNFLIKPLVNYEENSIGVEEINFSDCQVLIIEGTYVNFLENIDYKIFLEMTYKDSLQQRKDRNREEMTDFIEEVLSVEHEIIKKQRTASNMIITKEYQIKHIRYED